MEPDNINIYLNPETKELYLYIPASHQLFLLKIGEEIESDKISELLQDLEFVIQINFSEYQTEEQ
ncbi:hypothetical protein DRN43_00580 [Thermococci archaeon]|nr:MAG: hypothetical protein DRN43_00580 [Thermococci archaeon]